MFVFACYCWTMILALRFLFVFFELRVNWVVMLNRRPRIRTASNSTPVESTMLTCDTKVETNRYRFSDQRRHALKKLLRTAPFSGCPDVCHGVMFYKTGPMLGPIYGESILLYMHIL